MQHARGILLPDVFDPKTIQLGHILRNPLRPTLKKVVPSSNTLNAADLAASDGVVEAPYHATLSLDKSGFFSVTFTRLLTLGVGGQHANFLEVEAEKMVEKSFIDASAALAKACSDPAVESWIKPFARLRQPVYFVIGLQTLEKAKFRKAIGSRAGVEASVTAPLDPSAQMPVNVRAQLSKAGTGFSTGVVSGVFGIKVLKGTWATFAASELPRWADKPHWKWVYETKGGQDEEKFMGLEAGDLDEAELEGLQMARWADEAEEEEEGDSDEDDD